MSYIKFYKLAEDKTPFYTQWYANRKNVVVFDHED